MNVMQNLVRAAVISGLILAGTLQPVYANEEDSSNAIGDIFGGVFEDSVGLALVLVTAIGVGIGFGIYFIVKKRRQNQELAEVFEEQHANLAHTLEVQNGSVSFSLLGARPSDLVLKHATRQSQGLNLTLPDMQTLNLEIPEINHFKATSMHSLTFDAGPAYRKAAFGTATPQLKTSGAVELVRVSWDF